MARPRTPTAIKELRGSFKAHPERRPGAEMEPLEGIGPAPEWLIVEAPIWDEIVSSVPPGVLKCTDRIALEAGCRLVFKMRYDIENMSTSNWTSLHKFLVSFGLTPADRSRITAPKGGKANPFEDL